MLVAAFGVVAAANSAAGQHTVGVHADNCFDRALVLGMEALQVEMPRELRQHNPVRGQQMCEALRGQLTQNMSRGGSNRHVLQHMQDMCDTMVTVTMSGRT